MSVFFGNITSYSEHEAFYRAGRSDDRIMLAETLQNKSKTLEMISGLRKNGWQATASPAMDSDKSIFGNIAGVAVAINNFVDNRASSDSKGCLSENPFVTESREQPPR